MHFPTRLLVRLVLVTLESGTVASTIAVATLVYYLSNPLSSNLIVWVSQQPLKQSTEANQH